MIRAAISFLVLLLAACGSETDFDRRYAETEQQIAGKAETMERALTAQGKPSDAPDK